MLRVVFAALTLVISTTAGAQTADIPVPEQGSNPAIWFEQHIEAEGWSVLGSDSVAIALGSPDGVTVFQDGTIRANVRHEYYMVRDFGGQPMRSMLQTRIVDCERGRYRVVAMTIFARSNMQGAAVSRENPNADWSTPSENSLYRIAMSRICAAPNEGTPLN